MPEGSCLKTIFQQIIEAQTDPENIEKVIFFVINHDLKGFLFNLRT